MKPADLLKFRPVMLLRIARAKSRCKKENRPLKAKDLFRLKGFMVAGTDNRCYKEAVSLERGICILRRPAASLIQNSCPSLWPS